MKLLVISNNPLVFSSSNGRTLLNMLGLFEKRNILNVFISGQGEFLSEINYYQINENKLLMGKSPFCNYVNQKKCQETNNKVYKNKKTALKCLVRSLIWKRKRLLIELSDIISSFEPDAVLIQCGDSDFLINLSIKLSIKYNLPLISFNSEDYIFKKWDYLAKKQSRSLFFRLFMHNLKKSYDNLYRHGDKFIYLTDSLKNEYQLRYPNKNHYVIYNSSNISCVDKYNKDGSILYSGNLGVGRAELLIKLSKSIYEIFNKKVTICSLTENKSVLEKINDCPYIIFLGKVDYTKNIELMKSSSIILHVESFDDYYLKDTKNAFSTKIADCLSIGVPFFVVAPESSVIYRYLKANDCAFVYCNFSESLMGLKELKQSPDLKISKIESALKIASLNHNFDRNSAIFYAIVTESLK